MAVRVKSCAASRLLSRSLAFWAGQAFAQPPQPLGFAGRWAMLPAAKSHFAEGVTGPAPAAADLDVTKDDGAAMAWTLVEHDGAVVDANEFGNAPLNGSASRIVVDGVFAPVTVKRSGPHAVDLVSDLGAGAGPEHPHRADQAGRHHHRREAHLAVRQGRGATPGIRPRQGLSAADSGRRPRPSLPPS